MKTTGQFRRWSTLAGSLSLLVAAVLAGVLGATCQARAGLFSRWGWFKNCDKGGSCPVEGPPVDEVGGAWHWVRSPDEEKRVVMGLFNRYCIRCHGVDGRGIWDIPGVPDFTNVRWQASRADSQIAHIILEGRGAVMPPFRGALSLEEAWGLARYLRSFVPGTEVSRPDLGTGAKQSAPAPKAP